MIVATGTRLRGSGAGLVGLVAWAAVLAASGCRASGDVAESGAALLRVAFPTGGPVPDELRAWVYDDSGVLFSAVRFPSSGALALSPGGGGTVLIQAGSSSGPLRVHLRGLVATTRRLDGVAVIPRTSLGRAAVDFAMATAVPSDVDGDDVPDSIDDCPSIPNPAQGACPGGPVDAAPPRDGAPPDAGSRDAAPSDATASSGGHGGAGPGTGGRAGSATGGAGSGGSAPAADAGTPMAADAHDAAPFAGTPGCGTAPSDPAEGMVTLTMTEGGAPVARQFWLSRPADYDSQRGYKLVVGLGSQASAVDPVRQQLGLQGTGVDPRSDEIFLYPVARTRVFGTWGSKVGWQLGPGAAMTNAAGNDDLAFVDAMLDHVAGGHCIDPARVFVVGQGWGADFANALACLRGDKLRAATGSTNNGDYYLRNPVVSCVGAAGVFELQGKGDIQFPVSVGMVTLDYWLTQHACSKTSQPLTVVGPHGNEDCVRYTGCTAETRWCATDASFGGGPPSYLGREALAFFRSYY
jgi:polyhydroxybutyrate depolymerase